MLNAELPGVPQSAIVNPQSGDPLNLIRLAPSKGETAINAVPSPSIDGAVFLWDAPAEPSGDGALDFARYSEPKRCRASLATALHM